MGRCYVFADESGNLDFSRKRAVMERPIHLCPRIVFTPAAADPALQAADYLLWAVVRDHVAGDDRALAGVTGKVRSRNDVFASSDRHYY